MKTSAVFEVLCSAETCLDNSRNATPNCFASRRNEQAFLSWLVPEIILGIMSIQTSTKSLLGGQKGGKMAIRNYFHIFVHTGTIIDYNNPYTERIGRREITKKLGHNHSRTIGAVNSGALGRVCTADPRIPATHVMTPMRTGKLQWSRISCEDLLYVEEI
jgi:hypothetical protein